MESRTPPKTLAEDAYLKLRWDIVTGNLPAGGALRLENLRQRYGFSFSPLREALNRLQAERLVLAYPLRGFAVAPLSLAEMWDIVETRILIESRALALSIQKGGEEWEVEVVGAFHALARKAEQVNNDPARAEPDLLRALNTRNQRFHQALISACGSTWLLDLAEKLYVASERYRTAVLAETPQDGRDTMAEHRALLDAALARDAGRAAEVLAVHYRETATRVAKRYDEKAA